MKLLTRILTLPVLLLFVVAALVGCDHDALLGVEDRTEPDREEALASPTDLQSLVRGGFLSFWQGTQQYEPGMALSTAANEQASSWGNFGMNDLSTVPRQPLRNTTSYTYNAVFEDPWYSIYTGISAANDGLLAINEGMDIVIGGEDQTPRTEAFAKFVKGFGYGHLALLFDQANIVDFEMDVDEHHDFHDYRAVHDFAQERLDQAIQIAEAHTFNLGDNWINGVELTDELLAQIAYTQKARLMVYVNRTPEDRAQIDWHRVIELLDQGLQEDLVVGGTLTWWDGMRYLGHDSGWTRANNMLIGPADESGNFEAWLATPWADRTSFDVHTSDRRVTGPDGPEDNGKYIHRAGAAPHPEDRGTYHWSVYELSRDASYMQDPAFQGPLPYIRKAELDMLRAEALLQTGGDLSEVAELINRTRVEVGEMEPISADNPEGSWQDRPDASSDASLWALMKHEKRIETFHTYGGLAFFDRRGLGELVPGTALHFPVPAREAETFQIESYTFGGGGEYSAPEAWEWTP